MVISNCQLPAGDYDAKVSLCNYRDRLGMLKLTNRKFNYSEIDLWIEDNPSWRRAKEDEIVGSNICKKKPVWIDRPEVRRGECEWSYRYFQYANRQVGFADVRSIMCHLIDDTPS